MGIYGSESWTAKHAGAADECLERKPGKVHHIRHGGRSVEEGKSQHNVGEPSKGIKWTG